jgi:hypothetical protein
MATVSGPSSDTTPFMTSTLFPGRKFEVGTDIKKVFEAEKAELAASGTLPVDKVTLPASPPPANNGTPFMTSTRFPGRTFEVGTDLSKVPVEAPPAKTGGPVSVAAPVDERVSLSPAAEERLAAADESLAQEFDGGPEFGGRGYVRVVTRTETVTRTMTVREYVQPEEHAHRDHGHHYGRDRVPPDRGHHYGRDRVREDHPHRHGDDRVRGGHGQHHGRERVEGDNGHHFGRDRVPRDRGHHFGRDHVDHRVEDPRKPRLLGPPSEAPVRAAARVASAGEAEKPTPAPVSPTVAKTSEPAEVAAKITETRVADAVKDSVAEVVEAAVESAMKDSSAVTQEAGSSTPPAGEVVSPQPTATATAVAGSGSSTAVKSEMPLLERAAKDAQAKFEANPELPGLKHAAERARVALEAASRMYALAHAALLRYTKEDHGLHLGAERRSPRAHEKSDDRDREVRVKTVG